MHFQISFGVHLIKANFEAQRKIIWSQEKSAFLQKESWFHVVKAFAVLCVLDGKGQLAGRSCTKNCCIVLYICFTYSLDC